MATAPVPGVVKTQGTDLYMIKPGPSAALQQFTCPTGIQGLGGPRSQIAVPCLGNRGDDMSVAGNAAPGQVSVPFSFVPSAISHRDLFELKESGEMVQWLIALSDGTAAPTLVTDAFDPPEDRTSAEFSGYVADVNIDIATNAIVTGTLTIQRSGSVAWHWLDA